MHLSHGSQPLPIVKQTDSLKPFYCPECSQVNWTEHQSGTTFGPCTEKCCSKLTLSLEDFPAKTSALQEKEEALPESDQDYTSRSLDSLMSANQAIFSSKMSQPLEHEDSTPWPKPLPSEGMILRGRFSPLPKSERHTLENDGSVLLPTPTTVDTGALFNRSKSAGAKKRPTLGAMAKHSLWPTPTVCGNYNQAGLSKHSGNGLATEVGGALNPMWIEWLMGFPLGWTELNAWATQWFRPKREKRLRS